jgi:DNA-binding FadR family transcriptional regulator
LALLVECLNQLTLDFLSANGAEGFAPEAQSAMSDVHLAVRRGDLVAAMGAAERAHQELMACMSELTQASDRGSPRDPLSPGGSLAGNIAGRLAAQIVGGGSAGMRLGSEWDLCERFGVSRLTLRRAIRLLQDSGLVECRRGRGNGLIARDRRAPGSIRLLLAYLISEKLDPMSAGTMLLQLNCFTPALAVSRAAEEEKRKLQVALGKIESEESVDRYDLLRLVQRVSRLADSPVIDLVSRSLAAYEARFRATLPERLPASVHASYFQLLRRLLQGMTDGGSSELAWGKRESAELLVQMSFSRPI